MTSIVFQLDLLDNNDAPLEVDIQELWDYCLSEDLDFTSEFLKRVHNWMVYSSSDGFSEEYDPQVYSMYLDVEPSVGQVDIDLHIGEEDGGWSRFGREMAAIACYGEYVDWDDDGRDRLGAYLTLVNYDTGWRARTITFGAILNDMSTFKGIYRTKWDVVEEMIDNGELDPIPSWVEYSEDRTAESVEEMGYFTAYDYGWDYVVWSWIA